MSRLDKTVTSRHDVVAEPMGLAGRKSKQRIANDPRNLSWADDAARFGINYLAKFGWDSSKGLGASGEGRKSHLEVSKKLDMLGIGAAHRLDPNGIAWKQNNDFENLLKRLNGDDIEGTVVKGFKKADSGDMAGVGEESLIGEGNKKKRRVKDDIDAPKKKKLKIEKEDGDEAKEDPRANEPMDHPSEREAASSASSERRRSVPRHRAHRARAIAAKNLSSKSAAHISEILGIAPTSTISSGLTLGTDTPQNVEPTSHTLEIEKITTSSKSVHDYFKEKLEIKKASTIVTAQDHRKRDTSHDTQRAGIGSSSRTAFGEPTLYSPSKTPLHSDGSSQTGVVVRTQTGANMEVEKKQKRKKVMDEHQDKERKQTHFSRQKLEGKKTVDIGESHSERPLDREVKSKKNTAAKEDPPANFATKKKRKKVKQIID